MPKGERLSSECETERLYEEQLHLELTAIETLFVRVRVSLCFSLSDSPSQALTRQLFPFLALPFSPDRGKSFPKGEPRPLPLGEVASR